MGQEGRPPPLRWYSPRLRVFLSNNNVIRIIHPRIPVTEESLGPAAATTAAAAPAPAAAAAAATTTLAAAEPAPGWAGLSVTRTIIHNSIPLNKDPELRSVRLRPAHIQMAAGVPILKDKSQTERLRREERSEQGVRPAQPQAVGVGPLTCCHPRAFLCPRCWAPLRLGQPTQVL